jgi:putative hydrolase of the HAD superfamily
LTDRYLKHRQSHQTLIPGALDAIDRLRARGARLALVTNGSAAGQQRKIERFGLARYFDGLFIEGELGFGKPDVRVYHAALAAVGCRPDEAWSIGDNLEWDVTAPQRLGIFGIWVDAAGRGLPVDAPARPNHLVRSIADLP